MQVPENTSKSSPLVSVIIPAYNREAVIGRSIASVLAQTHQNLEIIVIDDASTDNTRAVVESIEDPRIRCIQHSENRFAAAARNTGIKAARGEYIAFLDSDDEWLPEKLSIQLATLRSHDASWQAVYCGAYVYKDYLQKATIFRPTLEGGFLDAYLQMEVFILTPTFMFSRHVVDVIGYMDESFRRAEDIDFYIRILKEFKIAVVPEPLAKVYLDTTKPVSKLHAKCMHNLHCKHADSLASLGTIRSRRVRSLTNLNLAKLAFVEGRTLKGLQYWSQSTLQYPQLHPKRIASVLHYAIRGLGRHES